MFTLKFRKQSDQEETTTVVSAQRYDVGIRTLQQAGRPNDHFALVITYPQTTSESGGVEFTVGSDIPAAYDVCFVENQSGKTIDRIGPFK